MTQVRLAQAAGVTQSVISAYASPRREPSLPTLARLVAATGSQLSTDLVAGGSGARSFSGPVGHRLLERRDLVRQIASRSGIGSVHAFGSTLRGEDREDSDIDLLVDLPPDMGMLGVGLLRRELEELLEAQVDIVQQAGLKSGVRSEIEPDLVRL